MELQHILDHTVEDSIVQEERIRIKQQINSYNPDTPFYVYCLCFPNGQPFYIGKGKNYRILDHFKSDFANTMKTQVICDILESGSYPIMHIIRGNLLEEDALLLEKEYIRMYGRVSFQSDGVLTNIHPGGSFGINSNEVCSLAGKIGGNITKENRLGIFSSNWDRSKQSKENWQNGSMEHILFKERGRKAGRASVDKQRGIHDPNLIHKRAEWARMGALALNESGNRGGACSEKWREENKELCLEISSRGGKIGGKITGSMLWWNNGVKNMKSNDWPGEGWVRGQVKRNNRKTQQNEEQQ